MHRDFPKNICVEFFFRKRSQTLSHLVVQHESLKNRIHFFNSFYKERDTFIHICELYGLIEREIIFHES